MADSPGQRVLEIRKALGDGVYPLSQAKLAQRLTEISGKRYDDSMVTKMERGIRKVSEKDALWLARLDPQQRGPAWVLCWPDVTGTTNPRTFTDPGEGETPKAEADPPRTTRNAGER